MLHKPSNILTKLLLFCGCVACILFITTFLILGATRESYNPFRHPISSLSIGASGWMQVTNFIITGSLILLFALGIKLNSTDTKRSLKSLILFLLIGIGLIGAGIFVSDPVYGYPAELPLALSQFTISGHLHDLFSLFVFICLPYACFVQGKKFKYEGKHAWSKYSLLTGFTFIALFIMAAIGFKQVPGFTNFAGLFQRLCIITGFTWMALLSLHNIKVSKSVY